MASSSQIQSPTWPLEPNNDDLERAQARAARANIRRKSMAFSPPPLPNRTQPTPFLDPDHILDLLHNCIKLASENKINQKNTWEFGLIDHLSELVRVRSEDEDNETNFQKASCTLEAGVKIYSLRVDSVHSETYKVLGGMNRAGREEGEGNGEQVQNEQVEGTAKKDVNRKLSPLTTLESSFEALNVKKFDGAFTVDPLYHQTSAQFDEGGAKGLLLNNLGVYGGCRVIFDSFESPTNIVCDLQSKSDDLIDLSFIKEDIEHMMVHVPMKNDISPTLRYILSQFDEDSCRRSDMFPMQQLEIQEDIEDNDHYDVEDTVINDPEPCIFDQNDNTNYSHDNPSDSFMPDENFMNHPNDNDEYTIRDPQIDQKLERIADFLSLGLGFTSKSNAWAGPDHWKYQKAKGSDKIPLPDNESELENKKTKVKKVVADIDFKNKLDEEKSNIFAPPKNLKTLQLPVQRTTCNITLPEDCHYKPECLVRLFVLPDVMCLGKKTRECAEAPREEGESSPFVSWNNGDNENDDFDMPAFSGEIEDPGTLVRPPRQVNKVDIQYDKVSKQVDVHALKEMLWNDIQESVKISDVGNEAAVTLKQVLHLFASKSCPIASSPNDISPHLFFICLLHLANEHGLSLRDCTTLDELDIHIPSAAFVK